MLTVEAVAWVCIVVFPNYCIFGWQLRCCGDLRRSGPVRVSTMCLSNLVPDDGLLLCLLKRDQVLRLLARLSVGMFSIMTATNPDACDIVRRTLRVKMSECNLFSIFYMFNSLRNSNKKLFDAEKLLLFI